jgi:nitrous oxidase accessory protein NosD
MPRAVTPARVRAMLDPSTFARRVATVITATFFAVTAIAATPMASSLPLPLSGATAAASCPNMQSLINNAAAGSTITIPACTYHQAVKIAKRLTVHASGVVIDGDSTRSTGLEIAASDVTVDGITVRRVRAREHRGAIHVSGSSRFTLKNATVRDSTPICLSLNGGTGHQILDSRLTHCGREGFFINAVTDTLLARNTIDRNNPSLAFDWGDEAGGGKAMASRRVTFDSNTVAYNHGPGIWFDGGMVDIVARNNRVHHNDREGIFFEISNGAEITGNAVWENGWGFAAWGYGAGITISSSDRAVVHHNTLAWNARGISVISQNRHSPPHQNNVVHDNVVMSSTGNRVAGWYDDHGGSLFLSANGNHGYSDRFWVRVPEPSQARFEWKGILWRLSSYNSTRGEEGGVYVSTSVRDTVLNAAGIPPDDGTPPVGAPAPADPRLAFGTGAIGSYTLPGRITWSRISHARAYYAQIRRDSGRWASLRLAHATSLSASRTLAAGHWYRVRLRVRYGGGMLSRWAYTTLMKAVRLQETSSSIAYSGSWHRIRSESASGSYVKYTTSTGAAARFAFDGRAFIWASPKGPTRGKARVYIDGTYRATINLWASSFMARRIVYKATWSKRGHHVVVIKDTGTTGHPRIDVDALGYIS